MSAPDSGSAPYFRLARGWADNPVLNAGGQPRGVRHFAWLWLIERAAWGERCVSIGGRSIELQRGELLASQLTMQDEWGWSRSSVQRFLVELQAAGMIAWREPGPVSGPVRGPVRGLVSRNAAGPVPRVLVVCNYNRYQAAVPFLGPVNAREPGPVSEPDRGPVPGHSGIKEERNIKMDDDSPRVPAPAYDAREARPAGSNVHALPPPAAPVAREGHYDVHQLAMIRVFDECRTAAFGAELARPWPNQFDGTTAGRWLSAGGEKGWEPAQTIALARSVIGPVMQKLAGQGKDPPRALAFHDTDIRRALRAATEAPTEETANVVHRPASADTVARRQVGLDPGAGRSAALAALARRGMEPGA